MKRKISVVVTDLDNTLYDWFEIWHSSFRPMLDTLVRETGIEEAALKREIRVLHQRYGTSEFSRLIDELPCLRARHPGANLREIYASAVNAYREGRRASLRLYPGVFETLWSLRKVGALIVGYTESRAYYTNYRVRRLCLDGLLDFLYSPPDHAMPDDAVAVEDIRRYPAEDYQLRVTQHRQTPEGEVKPNPGILLKILGDVGASKESTIYVGDSEMKDLAMAQEAGVIDVLAKYGAVQHKEHYELLREVSHWPDVDVNKEKVVKAEKQIAATYELEHFSDVLHMFDFTRFAPPVNNR